MNSVPIHPSRSMLRQPSNHVRNSALQISKPWPSGASPFTFPIYSSHVSLLRHPHLFWQDWSRGLMMQDALPTSSTKVQWKILSSILIKFNDKSFCFHRSFNWAFLAFASHQCRVWSSSWEWDHWAIRTRSLSMPSFSPWNALHSGHNWFLYA